MRKGTKNPVHYLLACLLVRPDKGTWNNPGVAQGMTAGKPSTTRQGEHVL